MQKRCCRSRCKSSMGNVEQRAAGFRRLIFFKVRDAAAQAFKRTYIGQYAETLRPSNQSHVLSATWTPRQFEPRAFSIHDAPRSARCMRGAPLASLLVEHLLAVVDAREQRPKLARKRAPMAHSSTQASGPPASSPTRGCGPPMIRLIASFARISSIRQSIQNGQFLGRLAQYSSDLFVASHTDKGIERLLVHVVAAALAIDQTPTLQLIEPAGDCSTGHAH